MIMNSAMILTHVMAMIAAQTLATALQCSVLQLSAGGSATWSASKTCTEQRSFKKIDEIELIA